LTGYVIIIMSVATYLGLVYSNPPGGWGKIPYWKPTFRRSSCIFSDLFRIAIFNFICFQKSR